MASQERAGLHLPGVVPPEGRGAPGYFLITAGQPPCQRQLGARITGGRLADEIPGVLKVRRGAILAPWLTTLHGTGPSTTR